MALITISKEYGTGSKQAARMVAEELGLELYSDKKLIETAIEMNIDADDLLGLRQKSPGFFERLLGKNPEVYNDVLQAVVYKIARQGSGIIIGHGSQILLKDFSCALHVRLFSPHEARVKHVMEKKKISEEGAERIIRIKDEELKGFFKFSYHMDFNDPKLYDLILNTEKIGYAQAAKQIVSLAQSEEIKACSLSALKTMNRRSLERLIHARLIEHDISARTVFISVKEQGIVAVDGMALSDEERQMIIQIVKSTPEVSDVEDNIFIQTDETL